MKYIEVTGWGNGSKHLIPLNKIVDFNFEEKYTTISFVNGKVLNVVEDESIIKEMLNYHNANLVNEEQIRTFYEGMEEWQAELEPPYYNEACTDELPF